MQDGVGTWFNKQIEEWFQDGNGMYQVAVEKKLPERNANGTYKDTIYYMYHAKSNTYLVLKEVETYTNGSGLQHYEAMMYDENWQDTGKVMEWNTYNSPIGHVVTISEDGKSILIAPAGYMPMANTFHAKGID
jgi:hypothetical protein